MTVKNKKSLKRPNAANWVLPPKTIVKEKPTYTNLLPTVAQNIVNTVLQKDKEYGASWKRRGGIGAYMMLVRKSDRLEEQVKKCDYDIFTLLQNSSNSSEEAEDTLRDLVAYGLLILAEYEAEKRRPL